MEWNDIGVDGQHTVKFTDLPYVPLPSPPQSVDADELFVDGKQGGFLHHGEWAWLARNSVLQIVSLRNGQTISSYEFCESRGYESCCIKSVEELFPKNPEVMLLAVVLESYRGPGGGCSYIAVYSVELRSVLSSIELSLHLTCARFMNVSECRRSLLQNFDGCLAVGSEEGVIVLLDMNIRKLTSMQNELRDDIFVPCHIVDYALPLTEIHRNFRQCQQDGIHFGLQMEVIESPCPIQSILPIDLILGLAIGLEDGRLALYDLSELQIFYIALPKPDVTMSAIVKMDFLEPPDDPRPCLFIWTIHENGENLHAVLHSLMYEKRLIGEDESSAYFETFQASSVRLQLPLEATKSVALACQAVSTFSNHGEDDSNCLCAISWLSVLEGKNKLLIFDLNQWYKEEMPYVLEYGKQPNYLAGYIFNGECTGLHTLLNSNSISHFNSIQRFEEHFYPNSLSFESLLLHTEGCRRYNWEGAQNRVISLLRSSNAAIFLEPNIYFNEIIRTRLMPQFIELNVNSTFSRDAKYEILLSAALENNCVSLLRDCAKSWIDGSFMGNFSASTGLSLSTLTDWIWKRATCIKCRCNDLCKNLFEFGGYPLDNREQKELAFITRQLKLLSDLLNEILVYAKKQIPDRVLTNLENKHNSLSMASSYQEILLWLLNIGLLPEASPYNDRIGANNDLIPYPYKELKEFYINKRQFFAKINETFISKKSGSCKLLFIDSFIEHVCKGNVLHEYWLENEGNGLYPPNSLEAMLRVMLVPELNYENKCAILLYFFLDLNMAIDEEIYKDVVANFIKFPSVFKLSAPLIKTVQAFWNLDHDHYLPAVDEFISPFNKNQCYPQWQVELLIEVLLNQKANNLALRILESQPSLISPLLKLNTLLANDLISEAFHFVRSKNDDTLLETFFICCLRNGRFGVIRDLALSASEGLILQNILKRSKAPGAESLHFVYLLQKSKYLEAVSYMDELSNRAKGIRTSEMDTPNMVLSAFNTTMTPVTQGLTDVYFRIKNKIKKKEVDNKSPVPLSCQLIKQNANGLLGGIYHSSALSAHFATYYWGEMEEQTKQTRHLLNSSNAPFLRRPQIDTNSIDYVTKNSISYPQAYKVTEKRTLLESGVLDNESDEFERHKMEHKLNPKKKRRLIGQTILEDLSHFMKTNKTSNSLNASEFTFGPEQTNESETARKNSLDLLARPLMSSKPVQELDATVSSVPEIHGILKTHASDLGQSQRETLVEEEKSLRFTLPSADVSSAEVTQNEDTFEDKEIVPEEKIEEKIRESSLLSDSLKLKKISRAVSEESNKSTASSGSMSDEHFYSPLSSQNSSKLDCSNLSKYSFLSGPQPRKPLARFSAERSEKSLTPEQKTKTTRPSSKTCESALKSKTDSLKNTTLTDDFDDKRSSNEAYITAHEACLKSKISPRRSLDRSNDFDDKGSSIEVYTTARESALVSKISPRRSLERFNSDQLKSTATSGDIGSSNEVYVTACGTFSKPQRFTSSSLKDEDTQTTSGFSSIGSQATLAGSKINEFSPQVSSSKVGTSSINKMEENKPPSAAKLSECSTVLGSLTTFECTNSDSDIVFVMPTMPLDKTKSDLDKPTDEQKRKMLETTLSMSTYDISDLDSTSLQQTKSCLMLTAKDSICKLEFIKSCENKKIELAKKEEKQEMENDEENLEENKGDLEQKKDDVNEIEKEPNSPDQKEESNYDCIVLSSSSSSGSLEEDQEDDYEDNYSDYERDEENEIDIEDNIEDDENYDFGESNESNIYNEDVDYDEEDNNNELSMEETDNSSDGENEDDIQLIEDSSSDIRQQQDANYYGESDSDDVKVVEDEQTPLIGANNIVLPVLEEKETNKDSSSNIPKAEKTNLKEEKLEIEADVEIIATTSNKSALSQANMFEKGDSNSAQNSDKLPTTADKSAEIVIRIEENVSSSTTKVIAANTRKWEDLKQKDILDITRSGGEQTDHQDHIKEAQIGTKNVPKDVTTVKSDVLASENKNQDSSSSKNNSETIKIAEATEEDEVITLRVEDPIDDSEVETNIQIELVSAIQKKVDTVEEKSQAIIGTGSEGIDKKAEKVEEKSQPFIKTGSEGIDKKADTVEAKSKAIIETGSEKMMKKSETVEEKFQATIETGSEEIKKKLDKVEEKSQASIETGSEEIKKTSETVEEKSDAIIETKTNKIEKKAEKNVEKSQATIETGSDEIKKKLDTIEEKSKAMLATGSGEIEKKADKVKEKSQATIETGSEEIKKKSETVEEKSEVILKTETKEIKKEAVKIEKSHATIEMGSEEIQKKSETVEEKSEAIMETETKKIEKKSDKFEEKSQATIETESDEIKKKVDKVEEKSQATIETETKKIEKKAEKVEKFHAIIEKESEEKADTVEKKSQAIIEAANEKMEIKEIKVSSSKKKADTVEKKSEVIIETDSEQIAKQKKQEVKEIEIGSSVIPMDHQPKAVDVPSVAQEVAAEGKSAIIIEKDQISDKGEKKVEPKVQEIEKDSTPVTTNRKRRTSRATSVPPVDIDPDAVAAVSTPRRNTRGISAPPQTISETAEFSTLTPRTRRNVRASSLQPKYKMEEIETVTPRKLKKTHDSPETRARRGTSVPPGAVEGKMSSRRRSVLLDAINEDADALDSPSTRTRLRSRLNSMDSEADSPMVGATEYLTRQKRTRKTSVSNNSAELLATPKRIRRDSFTSQPETGAAVSSPRTLRGRSVLSVQEEDTEIIPASPKPASSRRFDMKRKKSINEEPAADNKEQTEQIFTKSDQSPEASYSSSRRLTRTQLAMMEKSVALSQTSIEYAMAKEDAVSPPLSKRVAKTRSTRSSNANADSDDAGSVSSKLSTASSVTGTKRRITRSSIKGKDDVDDDEASVASSVGSEKHQKTRRSKDKSSPNTTLTTIPEDGPIEIKKRGRPAKH